MHVNVCTFLQIKIIQIKTFSSNNNDSTAFQPHGSIRELNFITSNSAGSIEFERNLYHPSITPRKAQLYNFCIVFFSSECSNMSMNATRSIRSTPKKKKEKKKKKKKEKKKKKKKKKRKKKEKKKTYHFISKNSINTTIIQRD